MRNKLQFGITILAAASLLALCGTALAQKPSTNRPPQSNPPPSQSRPAPSQPRPAPSQPRPAPSQPRPQSQPRNANRPPANMGRTPAYPNQRPDYSNRGNMRPPNVRTGPSPNFNNPNRPGNNATGTDLSRRQQTGAGSPRPWVDTMRGLSPQQRERVLQNSRTFQNLSPDKQNRIRQQFNQWDRMTPQQQANMRENEAVWRKLTPDQQQHIKNDVLPRWRQFSWDRQQVMKQKLGLLQHMPESARNRRLNDPNFTRGMSEEERSVLHDLAHTHVGAPEPPSE